jgi:hypothetical protein
MAFSTTRQVDTSSEAGSIRNGSASCALAQGKLRCKLPATRLDLQVRARGFTPHYLWDVEVRDGTGADIGSFRLERGASISGFVRRRDGSDVGDALVRLLAPGERAPILRGDRPEGAPARRPFEARTNRRGFFQLRTVPAGTFDLSAQAQDFAEVAVPVHVFQDTEAALLEPVVLAPPATLALRLDPPVSPSGAPWRISVLRGEGRPGQAVLVPVVTSAVVSGSGEWRRGSVAAGAYRVTVLDASEGKWLTTGVEVAEGQTAPIELGVPIRRVRGWVTLGKEPLRARLTFGGAYGATRVVLHANSEGQFLGSIPVDGRGTADVLVECEDPSVHRTVTGLTVGALGPGIESPLDIVLPDLRLRGTVVDEAGRPVKSAVITVSGDGSHAREQKSNDDEKGEFRFEGLEAGAYVVSATARRAESNRVAVGIGGDAAPEPVRLVLRPTSQFVVGVVSKEAVPVPGARVFCLPKGGGVAPILRTDADGRARVNVAADVSEVMLAVGAAGFSHRMLRAAVPESGELRVSLDRSGGTLRLEVPPKVDGPLGVQLLHEGSYLSPLYFAEWAAMFGGEIDRGRGTFVIPQMDPGGYALCHGTSASEIAALLSGPLPAGPRCVEGTLQPGSELQLRLPALPSGAR